MKGLIINDIEFVKELLCFKKGEKFTFNPGLNLIVGDQGCGKSTLIKALVEVNPAIKFNVTQEADFIYFDTEKHNPRSVKDLNSTFHSAGAVGLSFFESHGETLLPYMLGISNFENRLIFLDEPESGLSLRSQIKVTKAIKKAIANGNQLFISTHSLTLINMVDEVLSLEHRKWMHKEEFIKSQEENTDLPKPKKVSKKKADTEASSNESGEGLNRKNRKFTR